MVVTVVAWVSDSPCSSGLLARNPDLCVKGCAHQLQVLGACDGGTGRCEGEAIGVGVLDERVEQFVHPIRVSAHGGPDGDGWPPRREMSLVIGPS